MQLSRAERLVPRPRPQSRPSNGRPSGCDKDEANYVPFAEASSSDCGSALPETSRYRPEGDHNESSSSSLCQSGENQHRATIGGPDR